MPFTVSWFALFLARWPVARHGRIRRYSVLTRQLMISGQAQTNTVRQQLVYNVRRFEREGKLREEFHEEFRWVDVEDFTTEFGKGNGMRDLMGEMYKGIV